MSDYHQIQPSEQEKPSDGIDPLNTGKEVISTQEQTVDDKTLAPSSVPPPIEVEKSGSVESGTSNASQSEKSKRSFWQKHWYNCVSVLINLALAIFTARLYYSAVDQTESAKSAVAIAERTWKSQEKRDSLNFESIRSQNRAYIAAVQTYFRYDEPITVEIKNIGQTPAKNLNFLAAQTISNRELCIEKPSYEKPAVSQIIPILGAGESEIITLDRFETKNPEEKLFDKEHKYVIVYGIISYLDIFNKRDTTLFAFRFSYYEVWEPCETHNDIN